MSGLGAEVPRLFTPPARRLTRATSRGFEVVNFAEHVLGLQLMPWQKWCLIHGLELAGDGSFRFRTLLILCARQNGKTMLLQLLALWRIYLDKAPLVIGTAQNLSLAEDTWDSAVSIAEGVPDLAAEIGQVSRVNGGKSLRLTSGERYGVTAASRRGARGLSSDLVLLDELREHQNYDAWGALTKTTMARQSPQVVAFSNAGDGSSLVLAELRAKALAAAGEPSTTLGIFEWSAPDEREVDDPAGWSAANPALGHRMSPAAIRSALETDPEDVFRTEVLCQWVQALEPAISPHIWHSLADPGMPRSATPTFALDVAPDQSAASIAVAFKRPDGHVQVELADHRPGVDWVVSRADELHRAYGGQLIVESTGTAAFLIPTLERARVKVLAVPHRFFTESCAALDAAVSSARLRHGGHEPLNAAVQVARWSSRGDAGERLLSRRDPRVSPLVAAALAVHGVAKAKPRAGRFIAF